MRLRIVWQRPSQSSSPISITSYLLNREGIPGGMLAAYKLMKPMNILRLSTELYENYEVSVRRETAYNENYIYFDGFSSGDRVLLLDDVISSGATIRCIAGQMSVMGIELVGGTGDSGQRRAL
ncbi:hypothetical protein ACFSQ7_11585 [Paenibacillus rhizoplanae]